MQSEIQQIAKFIIYAGLSLTLIGSLLFIVSKMANFKLPGDLFFQSKNWKIFFPIGTCIILSLLLTIISWLVNYFSRK